MFLIFRKKRLGTNSIEEVFNLLQKFNPSLDRFVIPDSGISCTAILRNLRSVFSLKTDLIHITGETHYLVLGKKKSILTIHDVKSAFKGTFLRDFIIKIFWFWIPIWWAKKITVISTSTYNEVMEIAPFCKRKLYIIPNPYNPTITFSSKEINKQKPIILHMGTKENKNLFRVIEALKDITCRLIIVGPLNEKQTDLLKSNHIDYENHYDVSFDIINQLYMACDIVSFPSLYEGFGVPVLEANASGRAIVAGDIPVLREVADNAACFVNPFSVESMKDGFLKVINDDLYRQELISNGLVNIHRFSPERIAAQYKILYQSLK